MLKDLIVIDGFYSEPEKVRDMALQVEYLTFDDLHNFPGVESKKAYYSDAHQVKFQNLIGEPINVSPETYIFGKFRYSTKYDIAATHVHLDHVDWTGVIYLTPDEICRGGLGIYRHRETGLLQAPNTPEEFVAFGCKDLREFDSRYVFPQSTEPTAWEMVEEIPIRFNRLILFRGGRYFHGITEQFGEGIADSRLTQNFFFQEVRLFGLHL